MSGRLVLSEESAWCLGVLYCKRNVPVEYVSEVLSVIAPLVLNQGRKNRPVNGCAMRALHRPLTTYN